MNVQNIRLFAIPKTQKAEQVATSPMQRIAFTGSKDSVSFGGKFPLSVEKAENLAHILTNSTSGVRRLGKEYENPLEPQDFTYEEIVEPLTLGAMSWMKSQGITDVVLAHDAGRELTANAGRKVAEMLVENGFIVHTKTSGLTTLQRIKYIQPISTPEAALATREIQRETGRKTFGILLTPSHNPWEYGGYNFLTSHGEVASEKITKQIGDHMIGMAKADTDTSSFTKISDKGNIKYVDTFSMYNENIYNNIGINWDIIQNSGLDIIYDDLGGTGGTITPELFKENGVKLAKTLSTDGLKGPNPVEENMTNLIREVEASKSPLALGLANDGDVDRVGVVIAKNKDGKAQVVSFNDVGVALAYHQFKNRGYDLKDETVVIMNHATSPEIAAVAENFGAKVIETPVGFKYIGEEIQEVEHDGGFPVLSIEESGGGTVAGNIPEKDGPILLAMLAELVATEQKPLTEILKEIKTNLPVRYKSSLSNYGFKADNPQGKVKTVASLDKFLSGEETHLAGVKVDLEKTQSHFEYIKNKRPSGDGTKLFLEDGSNVLVRNSGTEPKTKMYVNAAGKTPQEFNTKHDMLSKALESFALANGGYKK